MDDQLFNRICLSKNIKTFLKICCELLEDRTFDIIFCSEDFPIFREKFFYFGLPLTFNFALWRRLEKFKDYFNWMKISKNPDLKKKRLIQLLQLIPDLSDIFLETHNVFDYFKEILTDYLDGPFSPYLGGVDVR